MSCSSRHNRHQSVFGTVTIHAPSGMTIASTSPGMSVEAVRLPGAARCLNPLTFRTRLAQDALGRVWWGLKSAF